MRSTSRQGVKDGGINFSKTGGAWRKVVPPPKRKLGLARNPPFCSLARISPTFCSVASPPIESRPCFSRMASQRRGSSSPSSGDHYNSETAGASCWSPRTWHMDGNFGLRAEDAAPRSFAPRDSGRPNRVRTRREVRLAGPALCQLLCNPAEEPTQASTTRPARSAQHVVILPASRFASHSIAPRTASASPGTASAPPLVLPTSSGLCPRAGILESRWNNQRPRQPVFPFCRRSTSC